MSDTITIDNQIAPKAIAREAPEVIEPINPAITVLVEAGTGGDYDDEPLWDSESTFNCPEGRDKLLAWMDANPHVAKTSREFALDVVFAHDVFHTLGSAEGRTRQHQVNDALDTLAGKSSGLFDMSAAKINRMRIGERVFFQAMEGRVLTGKG